MTRTPCPLSKRVLVTNRHDDSAVRREALFLQISDGREESQEVKPRRPPQSLLLWLRNGFIQNHYVVIC